MVAETLINYSARINTLTTNIHPNILEDLGEGMADSIGGYFQNYFSNMDEIFALAKAAPMDAIEGFPSTELWNASSSISSSIGMGIASTLIALFLFFELASLFNRSDTKGWDGIYWILMVFLKVAVMVTVCKNMTLIIGICFQISSEVIKAISGSTSFSETVSSSSDLADKISEYYKDVAFWERIGAWVVAMLCNAVNSISMILVKIVCQLRFIEIYVFTAVAPLPFCTFVSKEYRNIGISFIKRLLAAGLQGAFIALVCYLYIVIVNTSYSSIVGSEVQGLPTMFSLVGYSILLVIAVFQTGGWSKSLLQVN